MLESGRQCRPLTIHQRTIATSHINEIEVIIISYLQNCMSTGNTLIGQDNVIVFTAANRPEAPLR